MFSSQTTPQVLAERRIRQFIQQWFQLIESKKTDPERFKPMLAPAEFSLGFPGAGSNIRTFQDFRQWVKQQNKRLSRSQHRLENVQILEVESGRIKAKVDFAWQGVNQAGIQMGGRLRHEWDLLETSERFLRLANARVTMLEPVEVWE